MNIYRGALNNLSSLKTINELLGSEVTLSAEHKRGSRADPFFTPFGKNLSKKDLPKIVVDPQEIPQSRRELGELISYSYDLSVKKAAALNIPVVGTVSGGLNRRVIVLEWTRFKSLFDDARIEYRYGYVIRFCLTVNKWDMQSQLRLPFLTAQAEIGNIQASWLMQIRGLTGPKIDAAVLPPQELKVETFVIAKQSLEKIITAANDADTIFIPGILLSKINPSTPENEYWLSAVRAFALFYIRSGKSRSFVIAKLGNNDPGVVDEIEEVYINLGIEDPIQIPSANIREKAKSILHGIRVSKK